jgi:1,4-dihydroxy-2-naphthoyl-CoA synthase
MEKEKTDAKSVEDVVFVNMTEEGQEGRDAFKENREPNFDKFPKRP